MRRMFHILVLLISASIALGQSNYYVATDGNNSDPGTLAEPWATISYAMSTSSAVSAGDTINVKAGNYGNEEINFQKGGTEGNRITIRGYKTTPGDQPKDDWTYGDAHDANEMPYFDNDFTGRAFDFQEHEYITLKNIQITEYNIGILVDGTYSIIENCYITECGVRSESNGYGIRFYGNKLPLDGVDYGCDADSSKIINCTIVNATLTNIRIDSDYDTIIGCESYCDDNSYGSNSATDYYIVSVGRIGNHIEDCYIERIGNLDHGGHGIGFKGSWLGHSGGSGFTGVYLENNSIQGCTARNIIGEGFWVAHHNVRNNLITECHAITGGDAFVVRDSAHLNTFSYCSADSLQQGASNACAIEFKDGTEDVEGHTSVNNTFKYITVSNSWGVIAMHDGDDFEGGSWDSEANDNKFYHITAYNCDYFVAYVNGTNSGNEFTNCIVSDVTDDYYSLTKTDNFTYTYSDFYNNGFTAPSGTGNITDNPDMNDPANGDFTLQSVSPCIDAGTDVGLDYSGDAPDMGANEYEGEEEQEDPPWAGRSTYRVTGGGKFVINGRGAFHKQTSWWLLLVLIPLTIKRHENRIFGRKRRK